MRPKKLTDAGFLEIARVAQERDKIPSDKELAELLQVSCSTIKAAMQRARAELSVKMETLTVSRGTESDILPSQHA